MISTIIEAVNALPKKETIQIIAIDGRCAAGKTSLAARLQEELHCPVIHMDHFFLRPEQRTEERLAAPGGNVDYERFLQEVITPLHLGGMFCYSPFDCKTQSLTNAIQILPKNYAIIEGSYSCHPALEENYDLKIFLSTDAKEQIHRIQKRNGEAALTAFREKWIPLEETYFSAYQVAERCDLQFQT